MSAAQTLDTPIVELEESGARLQGCFPDMSNADYHSSQALSNSGIGRLLRSPAHYKIGFGNPTPAMQLGSAVHALVLEPHLNLVPAPIKVDRRTKQGKADWAEFEATLRPDSIVLSPADYEKARYMAAAVTTNEGVLRSGLLEGAKESSFFAADAEGCYRRARTDIYSPATGLITDLKTCRDASEREFRRSVGSYGYYRQSPWYTDTVELAGGPTCDMVFLCVENVEPYCVALYGLDQSTVDQGRRENAEAAKLWAKCQESGKWPGYPEGVGMLTLPSYLRDIDFDQ